MRHNPSAGSQRTRKLEKIWQEYLKVSEEMATEVAALTDPAEIKRLITKKLSTVLDNASDNPK